MKADAPISDLQKKKEILELHSKFCGSLLDKLQHIKNIIPDEAIEDEGILIDYSKSKANLRSKLHFTSLA